MLSPQGTQGLTDLVQGAKITPAQVQKFVEHKRTQSIAKETKAMARDLGCEILSEGFGGDLRSVRGRRVRRGRRGLEHCLCHCHSP